MPAPRHTTCCLRFGKKERQYKGEASLGMLIAAASLLLRRYALLLSIILGMVFVGAIALLAGLTCVMDASASGRERSKVSRRPKTSCNASRSLALISIVAEEMDLALKLGCTSQWIRWKRAWFSSSRSKALLMSPVSNKWPCSDTHVVPSAVPRISRSWPFSFFLSDECLSRSAQIFCMYSNLGANWPLLVMIAPCSSGGS
mmetsp:Transcript_98914/g.159473  ORF Transcript_98914/g.159473 Transcript_98914/m.159473 type:complete len:201 (-) Transcript_98914:1475-2077(-)